jgi:hypothetical protein
MSLPRSPEVLRRVLQSGVVVAWATRPVPAGAKASKEYDVSLRHRIETSLRTNGWSAFGQSERKLQALHDSVIQLAREVDNLTDEIERLKREVKRAA